MSPLVYSLLFALISSSICEQAYQSYFRREHSLVKPYQGSGMTIPNWDFFGSTIVTQQFIRLTPDQQSKQGGIFNRVPITFKNWEVVVEFKIDGHRKDLFGDGMAFWYVKTPLRPGSVFGHEDKFSGLGIFFDTYANQNGAHNHGHPYISAMVNNGSETYDHDSDGTHTQVSGCEAKLRGVEHDTSISITYTDDTLTVRTNIEGTNEYKECFTSKGVQLPTGYYLGFTAATGDLSDNHYLITVRTFEIDIPGQSNEGREHLVPMALNSEPQRDQVDDAVRPMSNLKFFFYIVLALIFIVLLVAVGIMIFNKQNDMSRKRFY